jgi:signal transduction histidine kinase
MTHDQWSIVGVAAAWSGGVGVAGFLIGWFLRRGSLRYLPAGVALVAVLAVVAGIVGTSRAMFLSAHDYAVVLEVSLVAGFVALVFAMAVGQTVVRWSRSLRDDARRFGESGEFVSNGGGPAEFQQLSAELTRTSERLVESRDREARLENSRRELVSWVSHDLRTPLAGLRAMTEALEDGLADDPDRYHAQMRAEVDQMVRMVDDLFELSRIHAGVLSLSLQKVDLGDLVSETIAGADPVARARNVRLGGSVDEGVLLLADPAGMSRVLANLVMNAIRHTPAEGKVEILGRSLPKRIELSVSDGCGGIPPQDLDRVFDVAWRGSHARTPDSGSGAGLGLAIVKGIVEAHHGTVAVRNEPRGCRFLVHLPSLPVVGQAATTPR